MLLRHSAVRALFENQFTTIEERVTDVKINEHSSINEQEEYEVKISIVHKETSIPRVEKYVLQTKLIKDPVYGYTLDKRTGLAGVQGARIEWWINESLNASEPDSRLMQETLLKNPNITLNHLIQLYEETDYVSIKKEIEGIVKERISNLALNELLDVLKKENVITPEHSTHDKMILIQKVKDIASIKS